MEIPFSCQNWNWFSTIIKYISFWAQISSCSLSIRSWLVLKRKKKIVFYLFFEIEATNLSLVTPFDLPVLDKLVQFKMSNVKPLDPKARKRMEWNGMSGLLPKDSNLWGYIWTGLWATSKELFISGKNFEWFSYENTLFYKNKNRIILFLLYQKMPFCALLFVI